jgi:DNA topoisomerase-1
MDVVVVESPAKAKTINKYLGANHVVIASFGHVRDLPSKDGGVQPEEDFLMKWEVESRGQAQLQQIGKALKSADRLILATDPDREGEAISWHIWDELQKRRLLPKSLPVNRVVFHEITKNAVLQGLKTPRAIDQHLVDAYLARRALDYLVGFTLSPVLWRKLPSAKSAGRVQSVALRLVCERENEIELFRTQEYWDVFAQLQNSKNQLFQARLTKLASKKLEKFAIPNADEAEKTVQKLRKLSGWHVIDLENKTVRRNPAPPFITSTLQQEASRKLGFSATQTMRLAQKLYEGIEIDGETVGLISYMRTDSVQLSIESMNSCRNIIGQDFGKDYVPEKPRFYKSSAKNAQEAHEAIRPTDIYRKPISLARFLSKPELQLYEIIWKRTVASQMSSAILEQISADISDRDYQAVLHATGSVLKFKGFLAVYQESQDDLNDPDQENAILPPLQIKEQVGLNGLSKEQHFTQPPPRYSEASLVKKLEELGIGRPSTYASILQVLQDRQYVFLEQRRFHPTDTGRVVNSFLVTFFERYFAYDFTAHMEQELDDITHARIQWKEVLTKFWNDFAKLGQAHESGAHSVSAAIKRLDEQLGNRTTINKALDQELGKTLFSGNDHTSARLCPSCKQGELHIKFGKSNIFIGCSNYPNCRYVRGLSPINVSDNTPVAAFPKLLGQDPATQKDVSLKQGPYGIYVQRDAIDSEKPHRAGLPKGLRPDDVDLATALALLSLPKTLGAHPETGLPIIAGIGRFGPYLKHNDQYYRLKDDNVLTIGINRAVSLIADQERGGKNKTGMKATELGIHPNDSKKIILRVGRYGPYLQHGSENVRIPSAYRDQNIDLAKAIEIITTTITKPKKTAIKKKNTEKTAPGKRKSKKKPV